MKKYRYETGEDGRRHRVYLTDTTEKAEETFSASFGFSDIVGDYFAYNCDAFKQDEFDDLDTDELKEIEELDLEMLDLDDDFSFIDKDRVKREFKKSIRRYRIKKAIKLAINIIIYIFAFFALLVLLTKK